MLCKDQAIKGMSCDTHFTCGKYFMLHQSAIIVLRLYVVLHSDRLCDTLKIVNFIQDIMIF